MVNDRDGLQRRLRELFVDELEESLRRLTEGLLRLESADPDGADVSELFRSAHGLKGAAHAAGVSEAVTICDRMESTFAAIREGDLVPDAPVVASLLADVDALNAVATSMRGGPSPSGVDTAEPRALEDATRDGTPAQPGAGSRGDDTQPADVGPVLPLPAAPRTVRVAVDKLDALLTDAGETLASSQRLATLSSDAAGTGAALEDCRRRWRALRPLVANVATRADVRGVDDLLEEASTRVAALEQSVMTVRRDVGQATAAVTNAAQSLRLQPFVDACEGLGRLVRDVAAAGAKQARLTILGGGIEMDRAVVAALRDPLLHLVRNAVDHGVEPPHDRLARGKPPAGTVTVSAELRDNVVAVVVADDGAGVDLGALRAAAERRGVSLPSTSLELAFVPGVSTNPTVSAVSGRGVGLDAVRAGLEQIGGSIELASEPGVGTTIALTAPISLATMRVLLTEAAGEVVCLPIVALERVATVDAAELRNVEGQSVISIDGGTRRAVSLAGALGFGSAELHGSELHVALTRGGDAAFVADGFLEDVEVVVKPAPRRVAGTLGTLGVALLSRGDPALVVNPAALLRTGAAGGIAHRPGPGTPRRPRVLLAEDSVTTRALERSILETAGYDVVVAVDGAHAWQLLEAQEVDLVVTDVQMPGMDGFRLCEAIREATHLRDVPVVLVTSLASDHDRRRGVEVGADAYFVKSDFEQGSLLDTIQRLL